jgi:hypothetical protein
MLGAITNRIFFGTTAICGEADPAKVGVDLRLQLSDLI